jgi:DNA-binding NarL/FixJ family response regulator
MLRVLLAVTHALLRAALLEYLGAGEYVCVEAGSEEALWDQLRYHEWDILILDLRLPRHTKLQTVRAVHDRYPNLPILAISFAVDIPSRSWQDAGASGLVLKSNLGTELMEAVQVVSQGGKYFPAGGSAETTP